MIKDALKEGEFFVIKQRTKFHSLDRRMYEGEMLMFVSFENIEFDDEIVTRLNAVHPVIGFCYADFAENRNDLDVASDVIDDYIEVLVVK